MIRRTLTYSIEVYDPDAHRWRSLAIFNNRGSALAHARSRHRDTGRRVRVIQRQVIGELP